MTPSQKDAIRKALELCLGELSLFKDDAHCEHEVGICSCSYYNAISAGEQALRILDDVQCVEVENNPK